MKLITHKTNRESHWARIDLTCVEDPRVSGVAKALHLYLLSRPEGWEVHIQDLVRRFKEGKGWIYTALKELEAAGYLKRSRLRTPLPGGRTIYGEVVYELCEDPGIQVSQRCACQEIEGQDIETQDALGQVVPGEPHTNNQGTNNQGNKDQERVCVEGYSAEFNEFLSIYPQKNDKRAAWMCWIERLNEGVKPGDMILAAKHYRDYQKATGRSTRFCMSAYTFLGDKRRFMDWMEERRIDDDHYERSKPAPRKPSTYAVGVDDARREQYRKAVLRGGDE